MSSSSILGIRCTGSTDDDQKALRSALKANPRHAGAATKLARLLIGRGETDEALAVLEPLPHDFVADGLRARAALAATDGDLSSAFEAWDQGDHAGALERFQEAFAEASDPDVRDLIRQAMVAIFTELGASDPLAREHRRRLSAALY